MIDKKGFTDEKIQELIDDEIKDEKEFQETILPMIAKELTFKTIIKLVQDGEIKLEGDKIVWLLK